MMIISEVMTCTSRHQWLFITLELHSEASSTHQPRPTNINQQINSIKRTNQHQSSFVLIQKSKSNPFNMPNTHHCGVCNAALKDTCIKKGHHNICPNHPGRTAVNKNECVSCARERKRIADAERKKTAGRKGSRAKETRERKQLHEPEGERAEA